MKPYCPTACNYRIVFFSKRKKRTRYTQYIISAMRRLGCEVLHINMRKWRRWLGRSVADRVARGQVDRFKPDAIFVFSSDILQETLEHLVGRYPTALLLDDYFPISAPVTEKIKLVDVFFHTQKGQLEEYRRAGAKRAVYVPSGVDPVAHRPGVLDPSFASDVAFIGNVYLGERVEYMEAIDREFDLKVYGSGWEKTAVKTARKPVGVPEFAKLCSTAKVFLGIDKTADMELYFSNRTWFALGCGAFLLTRYVQGLEQVFANHRHLVWYHNKDECLELLRFYLQRDDLRSQIAQEGRLYAHACYPNDRMAESMLRVLLEGGPLPELSDPGMGFSNPEMAAEALQLAGSRR